MSEGLFRAIRHGHLRQVVCLVRSGINPRRVRELATGHCPLVVALEVTDPQKRLRIFRYLYRHGGAGGGGGKGGNGGGRNGLSRDGGAGGSGGRNGLNGVGVEGGSGGKKEHNGGDGEGNGGAKEGGTGVGIGEGNGGVSGVDGGEYGLNKEGNELNREGNRDGQRIGNGEGHKGVNVVRNGLNRKGAEESNGVGQRRIRRETRGNTLGMDQSTDRDIFTWCCYLDRTAEALYVLDERSGDLDLQTKDSAGRTGLHYAAVNGNTVLLRAIVDYMQKYGINVDIRDPDGFTPYLLAHRVGHQDCAEILSQAGASPNQLDHKNFKSVEDWVWIGEREKSFFAKKSQRHVVGMYKVLGRLPELHAAKFNPQNINIVPSRHDRDILKKVEQPGFKKCDLFKQQTWLDFEKIKAKRLSKSLPDFHLPPLAEINEERRFSVSNSLPPSSRLSNSTCSSVHGSTNKSTTSDDKSRANSIKNKQSNVSTQRPHHLAVSIGYHHAIADSTHDAAVSPNQSQAAVITNQRSAAAPTNQRSAAAPANQHRAAVSTTHNAVSYPATNHLITIDSFNYTPAGHSLANMMKALEEQCTDAYRPKAKKKVVIPIIAVQPPAEKSRKVKGDRLKNHVLAKKMASKLLDKKERKGKEKSMKSKTSKISTISEEL